MSVAFNPALLMRPQVSSTGERSHAFDALLPDLKSLLQQPTEDLFDRAETFPRRRATALFSTGFLLALAGGFVGKGLLKGKIANSSSGAVSEKTAAVKEAQTAFLQRDIFGMFQQKFLAFFRLVLVDSEHRQAFFSYLGVSLLGYLSANLLQGIQEAWVRLEETRIRARLLERLTTVVQKSIRMKQEMDNQLRQEAGKRIQAVLERNGVPPCPFLIPPNPVPESLLINNQYFSQPTHRTIHFGNQQLAPVKTPDQVASQPFNVHGLTINPWEGVVLGSGVVCGLLVHGCLKLIQKIKDGSGKVIDTVKKENITLIDQEAQLLHGLGRKNLLILAGMYGLVALMRVGKLWFDGLREIEVTRLNAGTEFRYQHNNWLSLDPRFHQIAEAEALDNDLRQLEQDLRYLRWNRPLLEQRIQTILLNIGLRSAPKYFPMIPMVGLREARS